MAFSQHAYAYELIFISSYISTALVCCVSAGSVVRYGRRHSARQPHVVQTLSPSIIHVVGHEAAKLGQIVRLAHGYSHSFSFRESAHTFVRSLPHLRLLCCIPGHWAGWLRPSIHRRETPCSSSSVFCPKEALAGYGIPDFSE